MLKKTRPKVKVPRSRVQRAQRTRRAIPKTTPPEGGFLLNVLVGASEKPVARPALQVQHSNCHPALAEPGGAAGDPFDFREIAEDAPDDRQTIGVKHVAGVEPAHDFTGGAGQAGIQGVIHALVWLAHPPSDVALVFPDDVESSVG